MFCDLARDSVCVRKSEGEKYRSYNTMGNNAHEI